MLKSAHLGRLRNRVLGMDPDHPLKLQGLKEQSRIPNLIKAIRRSCEVLQPGERPWPQANPTLRVQEEWIENYLLAHLLAYSIALLILRLST